MQTTIHYKVHDVVSYINWIYFFHAWGFKKRFSTIANLHGCDSCRASWLASFPEEERPKAAEAMQLFKEANRMLNLLDKDYEVKSSIRLCHATSAGNDLTLDGVHLPLLRQQAKKNDDSPFICLSDFIAPAEIGNQRPLYDVANTVGVFASTIDADIENLFEEDPYNHLRIQTLSDRLVEAATVKMHQYVRKEYWGYAKDEELKMEVLMVESYQGIRPAVGYPSLPDQSINFILDQLIDFNHIDITLTENGAMKPHASVCGMLFAHPAASYFCVGKIGEDQLADYAARREMPVEQMRKFLASNLNL